MPTLTDIKNAWTLIPGFAMTGCALYFLVSHSVFWIASESAEGTVVGYQELSERKLDKKGAVSKAATVKFIDKHGVEVLFRSDVGSQSGFYRQGEKVIVIYKADDPVNAKIREFKAMYLGPFLLLIMGTVFGIIGLVLMPYDQRKKRRFIKNQ